MTLEPTHRGPRSASGAPHACVPLAALRGDVTSFMFNHTFNVNI